MIKINTKINNKIVKININQNKNIKNYCKKKIMHLLMNHNNNDKEQLQFKMNNKCLKNYKNLKKNDELSQTERRKQNVNKK